MYVEDFPPWFLRGLAIAMGLIWGSFLNVVIYRVPRGLSVVNPPSHCPACGEQIKAWLNVPVLSYLVLRGRAACCRAKVSPRYPLVEAIGGLLSFAVMEAVVLRLPAPILLSDAAAIYVAYFAVGLGLVAATFIDLEHMILPDSITYGGTIIGLATFSLRGMEIADSAFGAVVGFLAVWVPFVLVYKRVRGVAGMGIGDAKLLMLAGAWFAWDGALMVLGGAAAQGTLVTIVLLLVRGKIEEPEAVRREREEDLAALEEMTPEERAEAEREMEDDPLASEPEEGLGRLRIPFGPFLALTILEFMLFGQDLIEAYVDWIPG